MTRLKRLIINPQTRQADRVDLNPEQYHYLHHVLRLGPGDEFLALDGQGQAWIATLIPDTQQAQLLNSVVWESELGVNISLVIAVLKHQALDQVIHQATELGVTDIYPILTTRSLPAPSEQKLHRWQKIAQEATEQSQRLCVPQIHPPQAWSALIAEIPPPDQKFFLSLEPDAMPLAPLVRNLNPTSKTEDLWLAIGPEGGWTAAEIQLATDFDWQPVSLGQRTLRAMTAAIVGLGIMATSLEIRRNAEI